MAISRRELALLSVWANASAAQPPLATDPLPALRVLDPVSARELEALAAEIIPSGPEPGRSPGAREAGVIYFIDRALASFDRPKLSAYRTGLAEAQATRQRLFPASRDIANLPSADRIRLLQAIESSEFFELLRVHTVMGFLADPSYGGNRGQVGWKHIGLEPGHHFTPPFGFYDGKAGEE